MRKKILTALSIAALVGSIGFGIFYFSYLVPMNKLYKEVRNMVIKQIDITEILDGIYLGEFSFSKSSYQVEVIVQSQKITDIKVLRNGKSTYAKKAEGVLQQVIETQSVDVDVISGATTTSKALLKAVENALTKGNH